MHHFFTTESTAPPVIPLLWYGVMVLLIVMAGLHYVTIKMNNFGRSFETYKFFN